MKWFEWHNHQTNYTQVRSQQQDLKKIIKSFMATVQLIRTIYWSFTSRHPPSITNDHNIRFTDDDLWRIETRLSGCTMVSKLINLLDNQ